MRGERAIRPSATCCRTERGVSDTMIAGSLRRSLYSSTTHHTRRESIPRRMQAGSIARLTRQPLTQMLTAPASTMPDIRRLHQDQRAVVHAVIETREARSKTWPTGKAPASGAECPRSTVKVPIQITSITVRRGRQSVPVTLILSREEAKEILTATSEITDLP